MNITHILHLEDDHKDAELIQEMLEAADIDCKITPVQTGDAFREALHKERFDVILADYQLPGYDGISALRLAQELCSDVPFIFVSGTMGEDAAIEGLIQGARDYVLKNRLARLVPAVKRALSEAENQKKWRESEEALKNSEERYRTLVEQASDGIFIADSRGNYLDVNLSGCSMLGYTRDEILKLNMDNLVSVDDQAKLQIQFDELHSGKSILSERMLVTKSGALLPVEISGKMLDNGNFLGLVRDVTERKRAEEQIKKSLAEKEVLLVELYHRTRNNMAVIISLLGIQAESFDDERLRTAFVEAQNRIRSMALVHQKLYETGDLSRINLKEYINDLVRILMESYHILPTKIVVIPEMEDVFVLIDSAIPCGLILNELISNALKYAFPIGREGEIRIQLHETQSGEINLRIADNGVGLPKNFDFHRDGHLGLQNIFALGEGQLRGQVTFDTQQGVACHLKFQDTFYSPRV